MKSRFDFFHKDLQLQDIFEICNFFLKHAPVFSEEWKYLHRRKSKNCSSSLYLYGRTKLCDFLNMCISLASLICFGSVRCHVFSAKLDDLIVNHPYFHL